MLESINTYGTSVLGGAWPVAWTLIKIVALVLPLWASALIVLVLFLALAALSAWIGYKRLELHGPERTINSVKETVRWAKARLLGRSAS